MEWTEETIDRLRGLWQEGHSTAEIGRRLGVTKNAVVGKAHRLKLSSRPSPIRRERLASERRRPPRPRIARTPARPAPPPAAPKSILRAVPVVTAPTYGRVTPCCWPLGEPGTRTFRFCDVDTLPGKPYCAEHAQVAYVRVKDKRDSAA